MSSNVNDLLQGVLNAPPAVDLKRQAVVEATQSKANNLLDQYANTPVNGYNLAASSISGRGRESTSPLEYDLQTLSRYDLVNKYGREIEPYIQEAEAGLRAYNQDRAVRRSGTDGIKDLTLGAVAGAAATGHIASLGLGLVNDEAGETTSQWVNNLIEGIQGYQSPTAQAARRQNEALYGLSERDHLATPMGTMERIGRDAVSAVTASVESGNISDLIAQAGGSLLSGSVLAKAGTKALTTMVPSIGQSASTTALTQRGLVAGSVGGMEGGGAYADVISRIDEMSHQELMQHPYYRKIYDMTGDAEQAHEATKFAAAKRAGIQVGAVGALTGSLVSKFEANPLAAVGIRNATRNILAQTAEEGVQGIASPAISNTAIRDYADPTQRISEGVGRGLGEGAVAGMGISAIVQTPGVAAQKVYDGTKYVGNKLSSRIDAVNQAIRDTSPVSTKQLAPIAAELNTNIPEARTVLSGAVATLPVEQQEQANDFVERLISLGSFTEGQYQNPVLDSVTQGSASKLEALQKIGEMIADPNVDQNTRILGALEILLTQDATYAAAASNATAYAQLSDDSPAAKVVGDILGITQQILNNPEVRESVDIALQILEDTPPVIAPVTPESINTPEGQQNIDTAVKVAQVAPEKGNLEANQQILYHADNGVIELTDAQRNALNISNAVIKAERVSQSLGKNLGLSAEASEVNKQITLEGGEKGRSIAEHAKAIYEGLLNNDVEVVAQRMKELGNFAEHMGNKLAALNEHIANGVDTTSKGYEAWNQKARKWFTVEDGSKQALYYDPSVDGSENLVKSIFHEATLAAQIYNNMVDATGQGTKVPMPTQPSVISSQSTAPTTDSTTEVEATFPSVVIPEDRQREVADALGVSITRVRGYSEGKPNALTESQVEQARQVIEPTPTPSQKSQRSTLAPVEDAVKQLQGIRKQLDQAQKLEDEINNNPNSTPDLEDQAEDLASNAFAGLQKIGENLAAFAKGLPVDSPMRPVIDSINEEIDSDETPEIIGAEVAQGLRTLRNIQNSIGDLSADQSLDVTTNTAPLTDQTTEATPSTPKSATEVDDFAPEAKENIESVGSTKPSIIQRADNVLNSIKNKPHHKFGDTALRSLITMYKKGLFEYKVGNTLKQVPFDERIITTALDIYENNLAVWESAIKAGLDVNSSTISKEHQAILDSAPHTETVEQLFTEVAEVYEAHDKKVTQIDPQSIKDGKPFNSGKLPLSELGVKKNTPFSNYDICHACSANTVKELREAGIDAANPTIAQRDVSGHTDKMGDHKIALVRVNDTAYIVDQPQAEIFAPLSPTEANRMMPQVGEFSPRFIEVTPENLVELYGYTPNSHRLSKTVSRLKGIDSFDPAISGNIDKVIESISGNIGEVAASVESSSENTINVWYGSNENAELSNIAERPFHFKGVDYFSVEHAYQTLKSGMFDRTTYDKYKAGNQKIAGRKTAKTENQWNLRLMRALVLESFKQNPEAKKALLDTGDAEFSHTQDKGIWKIEFPRILENVRKTLRETPYLTPRVTTPTTELKGTAAVYSQLLGVVEGRNVFVNSYQFPKAQRTRFPNEEAPIQNLENVMENSLSLSEHLGSKWSSRYDDRVASAWFDYLNQGKKLAKRVQARFDHYINQKRNNKPSLLQRFLKGDRANVYENGLLLNIAEPVTTKSGRETAVLNRELLENATIASMDWLLNMRTGGRFNSVDDTVDVAKGLLGQDVEAVSLDIVNLFNSGLSSSEVLTDLGTKIQKYWGLQDTIEGFVGDQRGITESLARELLIEMINMGLITEIEQRIIKDGTSVRFLQSHDDINNSITVIRFEPNTEANFGLNGTQAKNLQATKSLLEELMVQDPEPTNYIGKDAIPKTSETQLRKPLVPLTRQQKKVQDRANRIEYMIDLTMASLYGLFGKQQLTHVFGGQDTTQEDSFNINHLKSVEGQNKNIAAAYEQLESLLAEISSVAEAEGIPVDQVVVRFKHEFASVNRLFLQGPYNPQTSKLMRDVLLPTWRNINLTDAAQLDNFYLALAQGLKIDIHRQSHETSIEQVTNLLSNELKDAVEMVRGFMEQADSNLLLNQENASADLQRVKDIFTEAGKPFNTLALKSLVEYVKFQDSTDLSNFNTSIYIEADGMTNGPANAMMLFYSGAITPEWVQNMERVGLYFNQPDATANSKNTDTQDTYQASADKFVEKITEYAKNRTGWQKEKVKSIHSLVSMFNSDFNFNDEKKSLTVKRGFMKNPLMVMIYGSSANGVANSMASALVDSIYERMSEAIQRMDADPSLDGAQAMFPEGDSQQQWDSFVSFLSNATNSKIKINSFQEFTLTSAQFTELSKTIKFNLVDSMYAAIKETVGIEVFSNVETMRNAISAMSIYGASLQKQLINRQMELYKEDDEPYSPRQLLKRKDLKEIERKIREVSAYIETANQNFHITGSSDISVARSTSTGLDGSLHMEGSLRGYGNAGVSGVAYMNQGSGDAQMVQNGFEKGGSEMNRVMPAFDGMHFSAADMEAGGRTMNRAVWDSWMANPMKGVADSFRRFMKEANLESMDKESREAFLKVVGDMSLTTTANAERLQSSLDRTAAEIQKNHVAVSKVPSATDQMAGTGATHINEGTVPLGSTDPVAIAEELNALREDTSEDVPPATIRELIAPKGRPATWVQTIFANALPKFLEGDFLNQDQKNVLQDVLNGKYLKDWEIFVGSPRSLKELVKKRGIGTAQLQEALNSGKGGFTVPGSKQIFIMNDSAETVLHEVIHAATFQKVLDHVEGRTNNVAVERIQGIMNQFMELTVDDYGHLASTAMEASALQRVIREARNQGNEAVAINEFMAWTLSNVSLTELAKKQTLPKVLQIAKDAWFMLKELIFGKSFAPSVGRDMYSNLRFNTALIIQSNLGVSELAASGPTLYHDTSKADPDLVKLDEALQRVIIDQLQMREGIPREHLNKEMLAKEMIISIQASEAATAAYFNMTNEEAEVFRSVVAALTVEQNLDRDITREANRLYTQVVSNLKVEDFMEDGADPSERAYANAKYSLVTGASFSEIDGAGRSTALPVFFALAMTNREFKDVLSRMKMPKGMKTEETGVDGALENFGYKAMDSLGSKLSGTGHATNVQQAMNILGNKLIEQQEARENRLEIPGRWVDKVNDTVVGYANQLANKLTPELTDAEKAQRTKWDKGLAGLKNTLAIAISEDIGARVAEDVTAATDRKAVQHWARELLADLVGRTSSNALIYDMIKQVRSTVQAIRQNYRVNLPKHIRKQFSRDLTQQEWSSLQKGIAKTDLASLALQGYSKQDIALWASKDTARRAKIQDLENTLNMSKSGSVWIEKAQQLAKYMNTGERGINLLRNAEAITDVLGTGFTQDINQNQTREEIVKTVDALVSLYAVDGLNDLDKANLASIVNTEEAGINYVISYLTDMIREERSRITPESKYNAYKGFIPFEQKPNTSLIVGHESQHADLITKGYTMVRDFEGANAFMNRGLAYYRMNASAKAAFNQGIVQTAKATTFGVDPATGYSNSHVVKRITDPVVMRRMLQRQNTVNPLVPVFDASGKMIAVEQGMEASVLESVQDVADLAQTIGKWKGRQQEEVLSQEVNRALVDKLKAQLDADPDRSRYEDVFASKDPVIKDAVANIPRETREYIHSVFGKEFLVQKNMLRDVLGYRDASVRDSWTGVTRMPQSTQRAIRNMATLIMKEDAYKNMVRAEEIIENLASNAKVLIAIKSGIVPALNIVSNLVHLVSRGVPVKQMWKGVPTKVAEIKEYSESKIRLMKLEADYAAATQANERASLSAQMQAIEDGHRRLSIWPLIEAGEFTAISDVDLRDTDTRITSGKWAEYFDEAVAKMPDGVNTTGRYFLVSKDTALFNGMQKAVEYGDLVAKAILYDDLVSRGQKTKEEALGIITEEFVNYDRLPGRARGKLEKMGLLWFYNFKLRSVKVAVSTMRNNPVHTLLALAAPTDFGVGDAGIPIQDNAVTMGLEGRLWNSIGPGQGINAPSLNPWLNIIN